MKIRPAAPDDLEAVKACAEAAYEVYVAAIGQKPAPMVADFAGSMSDGQLFIAEDEAGLGGFVVFFPRDDHIHLENVAVMPSSQGKGVGRALVDFVERTALHGGFDRIELYTNVKMTGNLTWYPKLGYQEIGRWQEDGFNRVFFRKHLR